MIRLCFGCVNFYLIFLTRLHLEAVLLNEGMRPPIRKTTGREETERNKNKKQRRFSGISAGIPHITTK